MKPYQTVLVVIAMAFGCTSACRQDQAKSEADQAAEAAAIVAACKIELAIDGDAAGERNATLASCAKQIDAWEDGKGGSK